MRTRRYVLLGSCAFAAEGGACLAVLLNTGFWLGVAGALHVLAAVLARLAASRRRSDLSQVEKDLVFVTALMVPVFGPTLAWSLPRRPDTEEAQNAHAVFEQYSEHVRPAVPDYERTLFTGHYEKDLARELDVESYHEVLRQGSTDQKRNALRRLAELGEPQHFALIRGCLLDPEHEVRLYAYSELERTSRVYEDRIARGARDLERQPGDAEATLALAVAYFEYADTGIHDAQMAAFYYRSAHRFATEARALAPSQPDAIWVQARAHARLGEYDAATETLGRLAPDQQELPQSCIARAEVAFERRDYATARAEAARLRTNEADVPPWLEALEVKRS